MQKWEYLREAIGADDLNARGSEGWELVGVASNIMFYKRPIAEEIAAVPMVIGEQQGPESAEESAAGEMHDEGNLNEQI